MPDNSQKLQLIQAIRQSGYPGSVTEVFQAYDQGQDLVGQWVQQQEQQQQMQEMQQQGPQSPQGMAQGGPSLPPPNRKPDGRVRQPNVNQPLSNDQGHLVQSQTPSSVGIQDLPTGPAQGQRIQAREGGVRQYKEGGYGGLGQYNTSYQESQNYQRIKGSREGSRKNPDGSHSTHLMADNNKDEAWPTLFQDKAGNWFEGGYEEAKRRGEIYKFDSREELINFARKGNWKDNYKKGGVRKSKSYIRKFDDGGVNNPHTHPHIDDNSYNSDYNLYANTIEELGQESLSYNDYVKNVELYGKEIADQVYMLEGKSNINRGVVRNYPSIGIDPFSGKVTTMEKLNSKYSVGAGDIPEGYDFNTYNPDYLSPNQQKSMIPEVVLKSTESSDGGASLYDAWKSNQSSNSSSWFTKTGGLTDLELGVLNEDGTYKQYEGDWRSWINQDPPTYNSKYVGKNFWKGKFGTQKWFPSDLASGGLTKNEIIQLNNNLLYNVRNNSAYLDTYQGPGRQYTSSKGILDYYTASDFANDGLIKNAVGQGRTDFMNTTGNVLRDMPLGSMQMLGSFAGDVGNTVANVGEWAWNNPKEAALFGVDILAGIGVGTPEPWTTGLGASWLAYRGADALYNQESPIGFNTETALNSTYFLPGASTYKNAAKTFYRSSARNVNKAKSVFQSSYPRTYSTASHAKDYVKSNVQNKINQIKTTFTKRPTFTDNPITRTWKYNVDKAKQGYKQAYNAVVNSSKLKPYSGPLSKYLTNTSKAVKGPVSGGVGTVSTPGIVSPNLLGRITQGTSGVGQGLYRTTKLGSMGVAGYNIGEFGYDAITNPKSITLDRGLNLGTDIIDLSLGNLSGTSDLFKTGLYKATGQDEKARNEFLGMFNPLKPITNYMKIYQKIKDQGNPNKLFSQSTNSPILPIDYSKSSQINPNATSLYGK